LRGALETSRRPRLISAAAVLAICIFSVADAEVITGGNVRVAFTGSMVPRKLSRVTPEPIALSVNASVEPIGEGRSPALRRFVIAFNDHAIVSSRGLPSCSRGQVSGRTTRQALAACRDALVGIGLFTAHIDVPDEPPFPTRGRVLAFNSTFRGHHAILAQVYGRNPVPTARVLPMVFSRQRRGAFGFTLSATMPDIGDEWGYVTGFDLTLDRTYAYRGRSRSFASASCPAPAGIFVAPFKIARGTFYLADGTTRTRVLSGSCRVAR
jgi:hypothetical protein